MRGQWCLLSPESGGWCPAEPQDGAGGPEAPGVCGQAPARWGSRSAPLRVPPGSRASGPSPGQWWAQATWLPAAGEASRRWRSVVSGVGGLDPQISGTVETKVRAARPGRLVTSIRFRHLRLVGPCDPFSLGLGVRPWWPRPSLPPSGALCEAPFPAGANPARSSSVPRAADAPLKLNWVLICPR